MGVQRTSFGKLQRDRAKKAKQEAKRERRAANAAAAEEERDIETILGDEDKELSAEELLEAIEKIHRQFENDEIDFEEFEELKLELFARLPVD
ncbi:MAG: hypothetical protein M9952_09465 [Microthrixaceae bacterium]|nr:hypothetical protein [Microthrixaceae bacterium]MCO5313143.1 hypothetical protein [Microthrixaceae bacterium]HPB46026.1 hypothetical protein [Microthrixaceae bacterium]